MGRPYHTRRKTAILVIVRATLAVALAGIVRATLAVALAGIVRATLAVALEGYVLASATLAVALEGYVLASAIIAAAGTSHRMEGRDKLWMPLAGRLTLARTVDVFEASPLIETIVLVVNEERMADADALRRQAGWGKIAAIVAGGARRQDSVRAGLTSLAEATQWVMIHDGARPLVTPALIEAGLLAAQQHLAAIAAVPVKDTIKQGEMGFVHATLDRANLWAVQTPQVFSFALISQAYAFTALPDDVTDDAALLERQGHRVAIFPGSYTNIKITTPEDVLIAEALLRGVERP